MASRNFGHIGQGAAAAALKRREREIEAANLKRKPQKNAAAAVEFVFSASPDWFKTGMKNAGMFLKDCYLYVQRKFGHVIQANAHFDEATPHIHILTVPIVGQRYTSSEFLGGREGLRELQQEVYDHVGKKYGLERGIEGSEARHNDQAG